MRVWQQEWDSVDKGRWTHTLIGNVEKWTERKHGEIDYYLTQALTNRGCFGAYLHEIKKADSPKCVMCDAPIDNANYTLFECVAFENWRRQMMEEIGHSVNQENLVDTMLQGKSKWVTVTTIIIRAMKHKYENERRRQAEQALQIVYDS